VTSFDDAAALTRQGPGRWSAHAPADWLQGRTTFGGLIAAYATAAAQELMSQAAEPAEPAQPAQPDQPDQPDQPAESAQPARSIRSLDVAFVAPLGAGPIQVEAQVLSAGTAVSQLTVDLRAADGTLGSRVHIVTGAARASRIVVPSPAPDLRVATDDPETAGVQFPYLDGVTPVFTQHLAIRWCGEWFPFTGSGPEGAVIRSWVQHRTAATGLGAVVALMDACPPTVLPLASGPAPASTVRWSCQLVAHVPDDAARRWFWCEAETVHSSDGYAVEQSRLFLDGVLVGWSEQLVTVYQ
jgi:hypothetical protein